MPPAPCPTPALEPSTIARALSGDVPALTRLYASYHPLILRTAQSTLVRLRLDDMPEELASEVWLRLIDRGCRVLRAFDPARGSFEGFMRMVAWQHALAVARRWQRRTRCQAAHLPEEPSDPLTPCATTSLHHRLFARRTLAAVPGLTAIDLLLIEEALLWQTPAHELAPRLGCSVNALHKRNERLRTRLRAAACSIEARPTRTLQTVV